MEAVMNDIGIEELKDAIDAIERVQAFWLKMKDTEDPRIECARDAASKKFAAKLWLLHNHVTLILKVQEYEANSVAAFTTAA
jgi:hypothetical protein